MLDPRQTVASLVLDHLRDAIDKACNSYRTLLAELENLETDVLVHVHLENHELMPRFMGGELASHS